MLVPIVFWSVVKIVLINFYSDEFADVKAVKLLRRGRRLQQVEYVLHQPSIVCSSMAELLQGQSTEK